MISDKITPLTYHEENQGKYLKSSSKYFEWVLQLNENRYSIGLEYSYFTGHRAVKINGKIQFEATQAFTSSFQYPFKLENTNFNIIQYGDTFELRINNEPFSHLYSQVKTQSLFKFEDDAIKEEEEQAKQKEIQKQQEEEKKITIKLKNQEEKGEKNEQKIAFNFQNFNQKASPATQQPIQQIKNNDPFNFQIKKTEKTEPEKNQWADFKNFQQFGNEKQEINSFDFFEKPQASQQPKTQQQQQQQNLLDILDTQQQSQQVQKPQQSAPAQQQNTNNIWESFGNSSFQPQQNKQQTLQTNINNAFEFPDKQQQNTQQFQTQNQGNILDITEIDFNQNKAKKDNITSLYDNNTNIKQKDINAVWDLLDNQMETNQIPQPQISTVPQQAPILFQPQQIAQQQVVQQPIYFAPQQPQSKNPFDF